MRCSRSSFVALSLLLAAGAAGATEADRDPTFGTGGAAFMTLDPAEGHHLVPLAVLALPDDKLLFAGYRNKRIDPSPDPHALPMLARMNADGTPDTTFGADPANPGVVVLPDVVPGTAMQQVEAMARLPGGDLILAGTSTAFGPTRAFLMRVDHAGALVGSFGQRGVVMLNATMLHALEIDSLQRIVVGGEKLGGTPLYRGTVMRFDSTTGAPDASFGGGDGAVELVEAGVDQLGYVLDIALLPDDRIVAAGHYQVPDPKFLDNYDFSVARLEADGDLDGTFVGDGWKTFGIPGLPSYFDGIDRVLAHADGAVTLAGHYATEDDEIHPVMIRLDDTGAPVESYGQAATPGFQPLDPLPVAGTQYISAMLPQDQGRVLLAVTYSAPGNDTDFVLLRVDGQGRLDAGFGTGGIATYDLAHGGVFDDARALTLHQGKPLVAGVAMAPAATRKYDLAALRLVGDGRVFGDGFE